MHKRLADHSTFHWLEPPQPNGTMPVADVACAGDPRDICDSSKRGPAISGLRGNPTTRRSVTGSRPN